MDNLYNSGPKSSDPTNEALDSLLQTKYDQARLAEWKKKIPMPDPKSRRNYLGITISIIALGIILWAAGNFLLKTDSPKQIAENMIHNTVIPEMDEMNSRGENAKIIDANGVKLTEAVELLKGDANKSFEALEILTQLSHAKNKYQLEALWFSALANMKIGNNKQALLDLEKLSSLSKYQSQNVQLLLNKLNQ